MPSPKIPLPKLGVDMLTGSTAFRSGAVRSATNVDIRADGAFSRRSGYTAVATDGRYTGVFSDSRGTLVGFGTGLYYQNTDTWVKTLLCDMVLEAPIDFTMYNGNLYACGPGAFWWYPYTGSAGFRKVGVTTPAAPTLTPSDAGTLTPGTYGLAISAVDGRGEESAAVYLGVLPLTAGLTLSGLKTSPTGSYRLYITPTNGDMLYLADEWRALLDTHFATLAPNGAPCTGLNLSPMPSGDFVRGKHGRLFTAMGTTLRFSEPMRPHLTDLAHNFISFVGAISFIEAVGEGLYVGDDRGVWWLNGSDPTKYEMRLVSDTPAVRRSSTLVSSSFMGGKFSETEAEMAVWLSASGHMLGDKTGVVSPLNAGRIVVPAGLEGRSVPLTRDGIRQIITLTASTTRQNLSPRTTGDTFFS